MPLDMTKCAMKSCRKMVNDEKASDSELESARWRLLAWNNG